MYTIIGRPNCKWCDKAKDLLSSKKEEYRCVDLDTNRWLVNLMANSGFVTVPLIFDKSNRPVGGYTALEELFKEGPL
jgi:glutaredoxin